MPLAPSSCRSARRALVAALAAAALPATVRGQDYVLDRSVQLAAGAARFELAGTGTTPVVALRADAELRRWLVGEIGLSALRPVEELGRRLTYLVPELQLQLQTRAGTLRPFVGAGPAYWGAVGPGRSGLSRASASAAAGVRIRGTDSRYGVRLELRARGIGRDFDSRTTEVTGAFALHF